MSNNPKDRMRLFLMNSGEFTGEEISAAFPMPGATTTTGAGLAAVPQVGLDTIAGSELYATQFPPRVFYVDGMIAAGNLVVLAGRPKSGKSWLMFQMAEAVDQGKPFLGRATRRASVLYLALEDGKRRIHERMHVRRWEPATTAFAFNVLPFDAGEGIAQMQNAAAAFDVVMIDTLISALTAKTDESNNTAMAEILNSLARFAHDTGKAVVVVHHTTKNATGDDPFDAIRGASSIRGSYDLGIVLQRNVKEADAIMRCESRDLDAPDLTIRWAGATGWSFEGDGAVYERRQAGKRVVKLLGEMGDWQSVDTLAERMGVSPQNVREQLNAAQAAGLVENKPDEAAKGKKPRLLWSVKA